jgi:hypothetical protein
MRYLIGVILAILIIIFVIIKLLGGGGSNPPSNVSRNLVTYATTDTTMRYTVDSPVQANETHRQIVITVGQNQATLSVLKGYQGEVVRTKSYDNNSDAYANFLLALQRTGGYTLGDNNPDLQDDRGYCANGERFNYDIVNGDGSRIQHYWSTSCKQKTFKGDISAVQELFQNQIPDYDTLTNDVQL